MILELTTIGIQILLPLALLIWLAFAPSDSRLILSLQVITVGLTILALSLSAIWIIPPWWTPIIYLALWFVLAARSGLLICQSITGRYTPATSAVID